MRGHSLGCVNCGLAANISDPFRETLETASVSDASRNSSRGTRWEMAQEEADSERQASTASPRGLTGRGVRRRENGSPRVGCRDVPFGT